MKKNRTKLYEVAAHVGRVKTRVTNHLQFVRCFEVVYTRQKNAIQQPG